MTSPFHVVLVEPEIAPNTGAVGRLCAATGTELHLIEPLGFELSDRQLKRAGLDYWQYLTCRTWPNFAALQQAHATARYFYLTTKTERSYCRVSFKPGDFIVFGRETKGLPEALLQAHPEQCLTIPMRRKEVRSLNLSTAVAIVLFEAIRQSESS